jgi:hypothetical protein
VEGLEFCDAEIVGFKDKPGDLLNGCLALANGCLSTKLVGAIAHLPVLGLSPVL